MEKILKSMGKHQEIEALLDRIRKESPDIDMWGTIAADYFASMRRFDDALAALQAVRESGQESWSEDWTIETAGWLRRKGDLKAAERVLREAIPSMSVLFQTWAYEELALLPAIRRNFSEAGALAEACGGGMPQPWYNCLDLRGRLQFATGQREESLGTLELAKDIHPMGGAYKKLWAFYRRAQIAASMASPRAEEFLNRALFEASRQVRGEYPWWSFGEASVVRALALARSGRDREALTAIGPALQLEPEREDIAYYAAAAYSLLGDRESALKWLQTAVDRGFQELWWARVDPDLDSLRDLPRFQEIMKDWDGRLKRITG